MIVLTVGDLDRSALDFETSAADHGSLEIISASSVDAACIRLVREEIHCVLVTAHESPRLALELLAAMQRRRILVPVIVYWPNAGATNSMRMVQAGAQHCITDKLEAGELTAILRATGELYKRPPTAVPIDTANKLLIGDSNEMQQVRNLIRLVGQRRSTVLITGETGTGKELAARSVHMASDRKSREMVSVNCAALPDSLLEAELFGHTKGAFTGAISQRVGRFEMAHQSTIFLDEIGEMPIETQAKLLRVLQEREIQRIGSSETVDVDVRVVAATNIDLRTATRERRFREDLLYRLRVVEIKMPSLRSRIDDVPMLVDHFIDKVCRTENMPGKCVARSAVERLSTYSWPGNVRELQNVVESAVVLSGDRAILDADDFDLIEPVGMNAESGALQLDLPVGGVDLERFISSIEGALLAQALRRSDGNKARAADMLRIPRTTLISKVKSLRLAS